MNITFTRRDNKEHLLLIMAGWGMDAHPFEHLTCPGYDIAIAWDYTDEHFNISDFECYREVVVIAWSMGVMESARIIPDSGLRVTLSIAVNGTESPVNDDNGIPRAIFTGTLETLSEATLSKFNRRMCGSGDKYRKFSENAPVRTIDSLRLELEAIGQRALTAPSTMRRDIAIIGSRDMIFPAANQRHAWDGVATVETDEPHLPDFQSIINRYIINKERVADRFDNTRASYDLSALSQHATASRLADKLLKIIGADRHFNHAIEIGSGSGQLTKLYQRELHIDKLELWDLSSMPTESIPDGAVMVTDDAEARLFELPDDNVDLIVSASTLQWFNSPANGIRQIQRILRPGGIAALSLYTKGTYDSLAKATGVSINYMEAEQIRDCVSNGYTIEHFAVDEAVTRFENSRQLIEHMRLTGVNSAGTTSTTTLRSILRDNTLKQLEYNSTTIIFTKR